MKQIQIADMEMIKRALTFLNETDTFYDWCNFLSKERYKWIGEPIWLHSDRWSATYDWVYDGKFNNIEIPEDIVNCLVEYFETNFIHVKREPR